MQNHFDAWWLLAKEMIGASVLTSMFHGDPKNYGFHISCADGLLSQRTLMPSSSLILSGSFVSMFPSWPQPRPPVLYRAVAIRNSSQRSLYLPATRASNVELAAYM